MQKSMMLFASLALMGLAACEQASTAAAAPATIAQVGEAPAAAPAAAPKDAALPEVTPDQVEGWLTQNAKVAVFDANGEETRASQGVVPGAVLLTSYREVKPEELPADKSTKLVFYCGGTACSSSDKAALQASTAGYDDVCVMRAGIRGWKQAGKKTLTVAEAQKANPAQKAG